VLATGKARSCAEAAREQDRSIGKEEAMRMVKWNAFLSGLCVTTIALGVVAVGARADVTVEKGASILIYPKLVASASEDAIIQLTNQGPMMVHAHCYYVDASLVDRVTGAPCSSNNGINCTPLWQETDFDLWLSRRQPTAWLLSEGRRVSVLGEAPGSYGYGLDPGHIPPKPNFEGELKCVEVDETGRPTLGNNLKGEVTLKTISGTTDGDVAKYNAIGIEGNRDAAQPTSPLPLDDNIYAACPSKLSIQHPAAGITDVPFALNGFGLEAQTTVTFVPCSEDFENGVPTSSTLQFLVYNEFEERFSGSTTVTCYLSTQLTAIDSPLDASRSIFSSNVLGTLAAFSEFTPISGVGGLHSVVGISENSLAGAVNQNVFTTRSRSAQNIHTEGSLIPDSGAETITLVGE